MSIQAETVLNSLKVCSDVKIVFKSLTSNKTHIGHYTLKNRNIGQSKDSDCLLYTSPSPRDKRQALMPSSA